VVVGTYVKLFPELRLMDRFRRRAQSGSAS
jgi:hypothetical protein